MLPKVFFSAKGLKKYHPDTAIHSKYNEGLHKEESALGKEFCHNLIDFYKDSISKNKDWDVFGFNSKIPANMTIWINSTQM